MTNQPLSDKERADAEKLLEELEELLEDEEGVSDIHRAKLARIVLQQRRMLNEDAALKRKAAGQSPDTETSLPAVSPSNGDAQIIIHGSVAPGANTGSGNSVIHGGAAGRDHITNYGTIMLVDGGVVSDSVNELERGYLLRLHTAARRIPLGQLDLKSASPGHALLEVRLDQVYVPLYTTETQRAVGGETGDRAPIQMLAATAKNRWLVILGDPGSGKTTFLNYLTLVLTSARLYHDRDYLQYLNTSGESGERRATWKYGPLLPIRIQMREFVYDLPEDAREGKADMVWQHIVHKLEEWDLAPFSRQLQKMLWNGECLVIFDGLDEITDKTRRRLVCEAVRDFADLYNNNEASCRIIVTCRVLSYTDPAWQLRGFPVVTLAPLTTRSINIFIDNWYNTLARMEALEAAEARHKARELRGAVINLSDLAQNPLLLTVMALVHTYQGTLPRERVRLYNDCVNLLLWDWQRAKQITPGNWECGIIEELGTREERLISGLCHVAFEAHRLQGSGKITPDDGHADIAQSKVFQILKNYLDNDYGKAQRFGDYIEQRAGLLINRGQKDGDDHYAFVHRGFQEFLAGRHVILNHREFARAVADLATEGDVWREVLLLAVGHLVYNMQHIFPALDAINLLCKATPPVDETGWRAVWWAGEMLYIVGRPAAEMDEHVGRDLVPRLIGHLVTLIEQGHLDPRERAQAADMLGLLGDPRPGVVLPTAGKLVVPPLVELKGGIVDIGDGKERHKVKIKPFKLGKYPVTNAQFRQFAESGYRQDQFWTEAGLLWRNSAGQTKGLIYDPVWGIDNRPAVGITWYEAQAYANWLKDRTGKSFRLPTEVEWECAAAGMEGRLYPFGGQARKDIANVRETFIGQTSGVGIFPEDKTPEGIYDLGGNVWEWCSTLEKPYPYKAGDGREDLADSGSRVLRGGGYDSRKEVLKCSHRRPVDPAARVSLIGFRVACDI